MNEQRIHRADGDEVVPFDSTTRIQHQDDEAFAFRVEVRRGRYMGSPIFGRSLRRFAELHQLRGWALAK